MIGFFTVAAPCLIAQDAPPSSSPSPTATPIATPQTTLVPGVPDAGAQADYNTARTPQASVVLLPPAGNNNTSSAAALARSLAAGRAQAATGGSPATIQPVAAGGAFTQIRLASTPAAALAKSSQAATNSTGNTASSPVPLAVVTLNYGSAWAGQIVVVRPLGGGTVSATDVNGALYTAAAEGFSLELDASGSVTFGFQAPDRASTFQVFTRLDNVSTTLTFTVPDGNE